ncbi:MAG: hypothetical protein WD928_13210 [Gammaproteobacteria bacterium]
MNPELQRLWWLEATTQRLWLLPAALLGSAFVLGRALPFATASIALFGFLMLAMIWGARQAANAVLDETRERTWDLQRMSALPAWSMTWGKLVGATAMPWYGGAICLALYFAYRPTGALNESLMWAALVVLIAFIAQTLAFIAALVAVRRERQMRPGLHLFIVLILLGLVLPELPAAVRAVATPDLAVGGSSSQHIMWYGRRWNGTAFTLSLLGAFAVWSLLGAYRSMCSELQMRTLPWAWLSFIVFWGAIGGGFVPGRPATVAGLAQWCSNTALLACAASYVAGFAFSRDPIQYRRVFQAWREGRWRRGAEAMPLWVSSAALALLLAIVAALIDVADPAGSTRGAMAGATALALVLLMLRDLLLLNWASLRAGAERPEVTTLVYLVLLYHILPGLLGRAELHGARRLLDLPLFDQPWFAAGIAMLHTALALALAVRAYRTTRARVLSSPGDRKS